MHCTTAMIMSLLAPPPAAGRPYVPSLPFLGCSYTTLRAAVSTSHPWRLWLNRYIHKGRYWKCINVNIKKFCEMRSWMSWLRYHFLCRSLLTGTRSSRRHWIRRLSCSPVKRVLTSSCWGKETSSSAPQTSGTSCPAAGNRGRTCRTLVSSL